ncbi:MAG: MFS transporter [Tetrasphaera sp.]
MTADRPEPSAAPPRPEPQRDDRAGRIILVLALCGTLVSLQQTLVLPLLPDFPEILDTSSENASWLVTIVLLAAAVGTPIVSRLADMLGKRRLLIVCLIAVILGSVIAALSPSLPVVITGRALSGLGACLIPVGISIMRDHLPGERVGSGVALMSATLGIGGAIGIPLAGVIYQHFDWHVLFLVSGAFAVLMLLAVLAFVPESTVATGGSFDLVGALLLSVALTCFLLPVSKAGAWGWTAPATLTLLAASGLLLAAWVPWELRVGQPVVDIRTSTRRTVLLTNAASVLVGFAMFGNFLTSVQQVQMPTATGYGFGLSVVATGMALLPSGIIMVAASPVAAWLIRRFGPREILIAGSITIAIGYVLRSTFHGSLAEVIVTAAVASLGTALAFAAMPTLIMRSVPITETASANGLNTLLRSIGTSSASALVAAVFSAMVLDGYGDAAVPSFSAYQVVFWAGAAASLGAAFIAAFIRPRQAPVIEADRGVRPVEKERVKHVDAEHEVLVRGVVIADGAPRKHAVVTVLHPDGRHVDWSRADNEGRYVLALPGPGRYLVVVTAKGWVPQSGLLDLAGGDMGVLELPRRLLLLGTVTDNGVPAPNVLLSVIRQSGEYVATDHTDLMGRYELPLPPVGSYVLTAVDQDSGRTRSRAVHVTDMTTTMDIDLATGIPGYHSLQR